MSPPGNPNRDDDLLRRMDTLERRQDDRHKENRETLNEIRNELRPLIVAHPSIMGTENYPGRMRLAEEHNERQDKAIGALKDTVKLWSGAILAAVFFIGILEWIFRK